MPAQPELEITPEAYLAAERQADFKSEYFSGEVFAMTGASFAHNLIVGNVLSGLHPQLKAQNCAVLPSDLRVWIELGEHYLYPDVTVVCGEPRFTDRHTDTLTNPRLIVEVLSKSTQNFDRGEEFMLYRSLPSFAEYLLIAQDRYHVEHFARQSDGRWLLTDIDQPADSIDLTSIEGRLTMAEIYDRAPGLTG
ncbi:MAG: Uma2 family endonuclease [Acidobacteriota bacterium]